MRAGMCEDAFKTTVANTGLTQHMRNVPMRPA